MRIRFFQRHSLLRLYLMVTDYLILVGCFGVSLRLRFMPHIDIIDISNVRIIPVALQIFFFAAAMLIMFAVLGLYKRKILLSWPWHFAGILQGTSIGGVVYIVLQYATKSSLFAESRAVVLGWTVMSICLLTLHRVVILPHLLRLALRNDLQRRVVVIGASELGKRFAELHAAKSPESGLQIVGFVSNTVAHGTDVTAGIPCLGLVSDLPEIVSSHHIEGAVITDPSLSYQSLIDVVELCIRLFGWVDIHSEQSAVLHKTLDTDLYFDIPFVRLGEVRLGPVMRIYKRTLDVVVAGVGLLLLSPLMLITAALVKCTSSGPVFYVAERIGCRGRPFRFYKFRSMRMGADQDTTRTAAIMAHIREDTTSQKVVNWNMVTPVGRFIRKWAIDELPQLFNVLKGDMSLVGPRPVPREEYEAQDDWQKRRFQIKPGCTGLWKIFAARDKLSFSQTVLYDIYYARNMSPLMDLYVILGTIRVILSGRSDV